MSRRKHVADDVVEALHGREDRLEALRGHRNHRLPAGKIRDELRVEYLH